MFKILAALVLSITPALPQCGGGEAPMPKPPYVVWNITYWDASPSPAVRTVRVAGNYDNWYFSKRNIGGYCVLDIVVIILDREPNGWISQDGGQTQKVVHSNVIKLGSC